MYFEEGSAGGIHLPYRPLILNPAYPADAEHVEYLRRSGKVWSEHDTLDAQLRDLVSVRHPKRPLSPADQAEQIERVLGGTPPEQYGRWIYYPWSGRLVRALPPAEFQELRLDRNRNKLTADEQHRLARLTVGICGLSVGNAVALTIAMEGAAGHLKLADFDCLELSNMNRIRAGLQDIGEPKTKIAARQIYEFNPYAHITLMSEGLTPENLDRFLDGLDVVVEECDTIHMKFMVRERARTRRLPVLMETSDRGLIDVERFDLEPERPIFHGLTGGITADEVRKLPTKKDRAGVVLAILGADTLSTRMAASMVEVEETLANWPQLASDVVLGGASMAAAVRRIGLGEPLPSGRRSLDLTAVLDEPQQPSPLPGAELPAYRPAPLTGSPPQAAATDLVRFVAEQAVLAPSGGNVQPWRLAAGEYSVAMELDEARAENLLDVGHRASYLALGACAENGVIAAASRGFGTAVTLFPGDGSVAHLRFAPGRPAELAEAAALLPLVAERCTNRRSYDPAPLRPEEIQRLQAAAAQHGGEVHFLTTPDQLADLAEILARADRIRFTCEALHREMMGELRWTEADAQRTRDGIDLPSLELSSADAAALRLVGRPDVAAALRAQGLGTALGDPTRKLVRRSAAAALLVLPGDDPAAWVTGGRALQRFWLAATGLGVAVQPVGVIYFMLRLLQSRTADLFLTAEAAELETLRVDLQQLFPLGPGQTPALLVRLGRAPAASSRSLRLPVEWVWRKDEAHGRGLSAGSHRG